MTTQTDFLHAAPKARPPSGQDGQYGNPHEPAAAAPAQIALRTANRSAQERILSNAGPLFQSGKGKCKHCEFPCLKQDALKRGLQPQAILIQQEILQPDRCDPTFIAAGLSGFCRPPRFSERNRRCFAARAVPARPCLRPVLQMRIGCSIFASFCGNKINFQPSFFPLSALAGAVMLNDAHIHMVNLGPEVRCR